LLILVLGLQSLSTGIQSGYAGELEDHIRTSSVPNAMGSILLLVAFAIRRLWRAGLVLGLVVGALGVASGLALIVGEIPYLQGGGEGEGFAGPVMLVGGVWSLIWLASTRSLWKARSTFAPAWARADRVLAVTGAAIVIVATGLFVGIGAMQTNAAAGKIQNQQQARAAVKATSMHVLAFETGLTPPSGGPTAIVSRLKIQIELQSPQQYALVEAPTLCLTSEATHMDPAYKPGTLCWGLPAPADSLRFQITGLTIPQDTTTALLELDGAGSPCAFSPGTWNAELTLAPAIDPGPNGPGPAPERYTIDTTFQVWDGSFAPLASGAPAASGECSAISRPQP
jgi:hypothetical protein